jgi:type II secretory pathway pseudopilin PulG
VIAGREGERGETLIELLITIIVMASAIISIVAAIAVASNSSDEHKKQVGVVVVLRDYAEAIINAPYNGCAVPTSIGYSAPGGYQVTATATGCYDGSSSSPAGFSSNTNHGAVRIKLDATSTDNRAHRTLEIVKAADYVRPT